MKLSKNQLIQIIKENLKLDEQSTGVLSPPTGKGHPLKIKGTRGLPNRGVLFEHEGYRYSFSMTHAYAPLTPAGDFEPSDNRVIFETADRQKVNGKPGLFLKFNFEGEFYGRNEVEMMVTIDDILKAIKRKGNMLTSTRNPNVTITRNFQTTMFYLRDIKVEKISKPDVEPSVDPTPNPPNVPPKPKPPSPIPDDVEPVIPDEKILNVKLKPGVYFEDGEGMYPSEDISSAVPEDKVVTIVVDKSQNIKAVNRLGKEYKITKIGAKADLVRAILGLDYQSGKGYRVNFYYSSTIKQIPNDDYPDGVDYYAEKKIFDSPTSRDMYKSTRERLIKQYK